MSAENRLSQRIAYWSAILTGVVFLYWSMGKETISGRLIAPVVISRGNQLLTILSQHVWLPAVGVLLIVLGASPAITRQVGKNRIVQIGVGLIGFGLIGGGGIFLEIPTSNIGEIMYLSPLFIAGILLIGLVLPS